MFHIKNVLELNYTIHRLRRNFSVLILKPFFRFPARLVTLSKRFLYKLLQCFSALFITSKTIYNNLLCLSHFAVRRSLVMMFALRPGCYTWWNSTNQRMLFHSGRQCRYWSRSIQQKSVSVMCVSVYVRVFVSIFVCAGGVSDK